MALMPLTRINPGHYSFSWKSLSTIYTIFLWILLTILVLIVGQERFHILENTKQFDEYIIAIMFVIYLTPHFWIPLMVWTEATEVALYINSWAPFQVSNFCSFFGSTHILLYSSRFCSSCDSIELLVFLCNFLV